MHKPTHPRIHTPVHPPGHGHPRQQLMSVISELIKTDFPVQLSKTAIISTITFHFGKIIATHLSTNKFPNTHASVITIIIVVVVISITIVVVVIIIIVVIINVITIFIFVVITIVIVVIIIVITTIIIIIVIIIIIIIIVVVVVVVVVVITLTQKSNSVGFYDSYFPQNISRSRAIIKVNNKKPAPFPHLTPHPHHPSSAWNRHHRIFLFFEILWPLYYRSLDSQEVSGKQT